MLMSLGGNGNESKVRQLFLHLPLVWFALLVVFN